MPGYIFQPHNTKGLATGWGVDIFTAAAGESIVRVQEHLDGFMHACTGRRECYMLCCSLMYIYYAVLYHILGGLCHILGVTYARVTG